MKIISLYYIVYLYGPQYIYSARRSPKKSQSGLRFLLDLKSYNKTFYTWRYEGNAFLFIELDKFIMFYHLLGVFRFPLLLMHFLYYIYSNLLHICFVIAIVSFLKLKLYNFSKTFKIYPSHQYALNILTLWYYHALNILYKYLLFKR